MLVSPWGRSVDALIIPRSYQETLEFEYGSVNSALNGVDPEWRERDLVVLSSHLVASDCAKMIDLAHSAGFDAVVAPVVLGRKEISKYNSCLVLPWDERLTICNDKTDEPEGQLLALGHDLWSWVAALLEGR
ncbi:hypothetical protein SAMN05216289_104125 [Dokdonella immobilis]|uniref:Uncharacterized protein n=2 Tax=Dokdonella immobilis TaxID=578942 RepID=A0A1I4WAT6_9GAMM|nr:hypothetical protein SAMN05216289_104125 [Dokdonella immobilis]